MADTVVALKLRDTATHAAYLFSNSSDGNGESAVTKIDISGLVMAATKVMITKLKWSVGQGMSLSILFDHDTDDRVAILNGDGELCELEEAPIKDPGSSGGPGDILFTTHNTTAGEGYTVYMEIRKMA